MKSKIIRPAFATALILAVPLIAMRYTDQVVWDLFDFAVMGALIFGAGVTYEWISSRSDNFAYRAAIGSAVLTAFLLIWINLAVGVIGNEGNPANLMFLGVFAIGIIGAFVSRLKPQGMSRVLFAMAATQMLVDRTAWLMGLGSEPILNAIFAALWALSGFLFHRAHKQGE